MPRKTSDARPSAGGDCHASMRPRPDAAENVLGDPVQPHLDAASMRPRPDAAENAMRPMRSDSAPAAASMRPRPDAAENFRPR